MTYLHNSLLITLLLVAFSYGQCPENNARCTGTNTYQVCTGGVYGANQTCQNGLVCSTSGNNAFCVRSSEVTTGFANPSTTGAAMMTSGTACTENNARCTGNNTYQVCTGGVYGANQTCQDGLVCSSSGNNAFCVRPSEVTTGVNTPSTTSAAPRMTTGAATMSTGAATTTTTGTACTENNVRCTGNNTYQVCTGGVYGANQTCQNGLVCSPSGNTAFCVRPSEVTTGANVPSTTSTAPRMTTGAATMSTGAATTTTTGTACTENNVRCTGNNTYQVCTGGVYGANQTCQSGLVCSPSGNTAFCVRPSEVTTGANVPSTTSTASGMTTGAATTTTTGTACTENNVRCTGNNTYQVCTGGVYGANQTCQSGLVCSPSGNTAFCVRPSEVTTGVAATGSTATAGTTSTGQMTTGASGTTGNNNNTNGTACTPNGSQKCLSSSTYSTCTNGFFSQSQSCPTGLVCSPSGNNIYCVRGVTPGQPCSNSGYQSCLTSETYSTCTNNQGSNAQSCPVGTTCHPSGNNIYCY